MGAAVTKPGPNAGVARVAATFLVRGNDNSAGRRGRAGRPRARRRRAGAGGARRRGRAPLGLAVPVRHGITKALAQRHELVAAVLRRLDHVGRQVGDGLLVHVVRKDNVRVARGIGRHAGAELVLGVLDQHRRVILPVLGVEVGADDVVAQLAHQRLAAGAGAALQVRGPHVSGDPPEDVAEGHFVVDHLGPLDGAVDLVQIAMSPGVAGNVVAGGIHATQHARPAQGRVVDVTLAPVVSGNHEGCLGIVLVQEIQNLTGVSVRAVIKGQCDHARLDAGRDEAACDDSVSCR